MPQERGHHHREINSLHHSFIYHRCTGINNRVYFVNLGEWMIEGKWSVSYCNNSELDASKPWMKPRTRSNQKAFH